METEVETDIVGTRLTVFYPEGQDDHYLTLRMEDVQEELDNTLADPDYYPRFIHFDTILGPRVYLDVNSIIRVDVERAILVRGDLVSEPVRPAKKVAGPRPKRPAVAKKPTGQ